jgi:hypothetical protein
MTVTTDGYETTTRNEVSTTGRRRAVRPAVKFSHEILLQEVIKFNILVLLLLALPLVKGRDTRLKTIILRIAAPSICLRTPMTYCKLGEMG